MKKSMIMILALMILFTVNSSLLYPQNKPKLIPAKDGSGIVGYKDTPILPWCGYHKHDPDRPEPQMITPGTPGTQAKAGTAPSDAIVLFDGSDLSQWEPSEWKIENGELITTDGVLRSKEKFGDIQLHLEWATPNPPQGELFNRGNNGVGLMGVFQIQIFDSYSVKIYPDGQAAAIYGETPPLVNACRKPGEWQSFDIIFIAPVFQFGKLVERARTTIFHNGVLVHYNQEIMAPTVHRNMFYYQNILKTGPIELMDHHNPVRFRNIWVRPF